MNQGHLKNNYKGTLILLQNHYIAVIKKNIDYFTSIYSQQHVYFLLNSIGPTVVIGTIDGIIEKIIEQDPRRIVNVFTK